MHFVKIIIMTEPVKQIVNKELHQTPVHEIAESEPVHDLESKEISSNNQAAIKHKKKRRKHRRVKPQKDPEQIKQIKLERLNFKREQLWNNRFINDTIPDLYNKAKKKKSHVFKRNKSPLQTVYMERDINKQHKLPHLSTKQHQRQSIQKNTHKSFNIRTVTAKKEGFKKTNKNISKSQQAQDKIKPNLKIQKEENRSKESQNKQEEAPKPKQNKLLVKLQQKSKIHHINEHYKTLLIDLIQLQSAKKSKELRIMLEQQISTIGQDKNVYHRIDSMIKQRKDLIKSIKQTGENTTLRTLITFQITSVGLIEQILKFKAKWQEQYYKLENQKKVSYFYGGKNYLLLMKDQVKQLQQGQNDPFLVCRTSKLQNLVGGVLKQQQLQEKRQIMLKMRACELLLIEQELSQGKQ